MGSLKSGTSQTGIGAGKTYDIKKAGMLNTKSLSKNGKPKDKGE